LSRLLAQAATALRSALQGLRASPGPAALAAVTIGLTLVLVGAFALLVSNMERLLARFGEDILVSAYLEEGLSEAQTRTLLEQVDGAPGVASVSLVSQEEALRRFREGAFGRPSLLDGLDENPLPASLEISLVPERRSAEGLALLEAALRDLPGIAELGYGHEWVEGYARAVSLIRGVAIALGGVLALATLLIVANTIRLALYARRDEIAILRLVGASRLFVAVPFLLEGLLQGLAGGLMALVLLFGFFRALLPALAGGLELLLGYATPSFLSLEGALLLVAAGAGLGVLGSAAALLQGSEA
jgi:cell division transport system permease protein